MSSIMSNIASLSTTTLVLMAAIFTPVHVTFTCIEIAHFASMYDPRTWYCRALIYYKIGMFEKNKFGGNGKVSSSITHF